MRGSGAQVSDVTGFKPTRKSAVEGAFVLIVDDELSIRRTLEQILKEEGYLTLTANDGSSALDILKSCLAAGQVPDLVLLDIWMPGSDGIETLQDMRALLPNLAVIMMSGHATIGTAVRSTKLGAVDFIEKPLDLELLLHSVSRALALPKTEKLTPKNEDTLVPEFSMQGGNAGLELRPVVFDSQRAPGRKITQKTLKNSALLYGQGLHTGQKSGLTLEPLPANSGIHFGSVSKRGIVPSHVDFVESTGYATTVKAGEVQAGTIEHLLSALHAYQISNLLVKCNGEIPVMDGSAREFCQLFDEIGIEEQGGDWFEIEVREPVEITTPKGEFIRIEPALNFTVEYHLQYPAPVGSQVFLFSLDSKEAYKREIAPARTFGFVKDIGWLQQQGLARGGRFDNFVLFDEKGPVNCALRFPDEPVRHKVLDLIGDIYLLGRPIRGKITAKMTGHSDNIAILRALKQAMESWG